MDMSFYYRRAFLAILWLSVVSWLRAQTADLVLTNGRIWTGVRGAPFQQAVAIRGNSIVSVGTSAAVAGLQGPGTKVIDLKGRFTMPGFNDAHIHFSGGSERLNEVDLTGVCTVPSIQKYIAEYAAAHPDAAWIRGGGWEYTCFPNGRLPTRQDLDAVVADRPVFLSAYDGHTGWANSKALEIAGIGKGRKFDGFGEIVLDTETQLPTGCLKEGAQGIVRRLLPRRTREEQLAALEKGVKLANSLGITSLQNASGSPEEVELYEQLLKDGKMTLRAGIAMSAGQMTTTPDVVSRWVSLGRKHAGPVLRVGAVKFVLDGVIESHTASMLDLYSDGSKTSGKLAWVPASYKEALTLVDKAGLQIYTHAIGDAAVRLALDGYEQVRRVNGVRDSRHRIEHIEVISERDVPRFASLGVMASMEPIHCDPDTVAVWSRAVGPERLKLAFAWRALEKAGAKLVFSSDWPASISLDPIRGIHNAVNRQTIDGKPAGGWLPEHRVSLETALHGYTTVGAFAEFEEKRKGTIEVGKLADLVVLSRDPFSISSSELHTMRVETTVFDGRIVFEK
jgi:predicted amidohydrolase YtcJ